MRDSINKPKVFLSHSSLDKEFINRLAADLRRCQIDHWLDTEEIRDGRPWLQVIFAHGIPMCDAVLLYLTENSLKSKMVAKEMDAALVEQLGERGIALLPYVSSGELRDRLRSDIKPLHCREWNDLNYSDVLPTVVAEIWRSYVERMIGTATLLERNRRLELELEVKSLQEHFTNAAFTPQEEREFTYIRQKLDRTIEIQVELYQTDKGSHNSVKTGEEVYCINLLGAIIHHVSRGYRRFSTSVVEIPLREIITKAHPPTVGNYHCTIKEDLPLELCTYGLARPYEHGLGGLKIDVCEFTEKMYRFIYWLEFNIYLPELALFLLSKREISDSDLHTSELEDTDLTYALRLDREIAFNEHRAKWRESSIGVGAAQHEVKKLFEGLERLARINNEKLEKIKLKYLGDDENRCSVSSRGISLIVEWNLNFTDTLNGSVLLAEEYKSKHVTGGSETLTEQDRLFHGEYDFDIDEEQTVYWQWRAQKDRRLSTEDLAKSLISSLLSAIRRETVSGR